MFIIKNYLDDVTSAIEEFHSDFEFDGAYGENRFLYTEVLNQHKKLLLALLQQSNATDADDALKEFVFFCVSNDIPYMYLYGEILSIIRNLVKRSMAEKNYEAIQELNDYFDMLGIRIADAYFRKFLRRLVTKNHLRLSHISNLVEKNLMIHYQRHVEWLIRLIDFIQHPSDIHSFPELHHENCPFGRWLHDTSIPYIVSTSHFKDVIELHKKLHSFAADIVRHMQIAQSGPKHTIQLMQRIDYLSLEIGNEIAILNDMIMIEEYTKDPLTGLLTRRLFEKVITAQIEIARSTESNCTLMMCDLDHFKTINDTYTHGGGDAVIVHFSEILKTLLRKSDFIFRYGGEEFIILLPSTTETDARKIARKICEHVRQTDAVYDNQAISYTVSIGVSPIDTDSSGVILKETIQHYVAQVDAKLYLAKQNGRNRVE